MPSRLVNDTAITQKHAVRNQIDEHRRALRSLGVEQPVVHVLPVGREDRPAPPQPAVDRERGVHQRHGEREQRHHEGEHRQLAVALEREQREVEADEQRTGVAEEDTRGREVVGQEAEQCAEEGEAREHAHGLARLERDEGERRADDAADAGGQTVEAVHQVHGVGDAHDPEPGHDPHQGFRESPDLQRERVGQMVDAETVEDGDGGGRHLERQLGARRKCLAVVDHADREQDQRTEQLTLDVAAIRVLAAGQDQRHGETDEEAERDRDAAEERDVAAQVDLARIGPVDRAERVGDARGDRRRRGRHRGGDREGCQVLERAHGHISCSGAQ